MNSETRRREERNHRETRGDHNCIVNYWKERKIIFNMAPNIWSHNMAPLSIGSHNMAPALRASATTLFSQPTVTRPSVEEHITCSHIICIINNILSISNCQFRKNTWPVLALFDILLFSSIHVCFLDLQKFHLGKLSFQMMVIGVVEMITMILNRPEFRI